MLTVVGGKVVYAAAPFETLAPPPLPPVSPAWSPVAHFGGYQRRAREVSGQSRAELRRADRRGAADCCRTQPAAAMSARLQDAAPGRGLVVPARAGVARDALVDSMKYRAARVRKRELRVVRRRGAAPLRLRAPSGVGSGSAGRPRRLLQRYLLHADVRRDAALPRVRAAAQCVRDGRAAESRARWRRASWPCSSAFADSRRSPATATRHDCASAARSCASARNGSCRCAKAQRPTPFRRARARLRTRGWELDGVALFPAETSAASSRTAPIRTSRCGDVYAVSPEFHGHRRAGRPVLPGLQTTSRTYAAGAADETRHTFGTRIWGARTAGTGTGRRFISVGPFDDGDLEAWTWRAIPATRSRRAWTPRIGFNANVASRRRRRRRRLARDVQPVVSTRYLFRRAGTARARATSSTCTRSVTLHPRGDVTLTADVDFYWRLREADGVYDPTGRLLRAPAGSEPLREHACLGLPRSGRRIATCSSRSSTRTSSRASSCATRARITTSTSWS